MFAMLQFVDDSHESFKTWRGAHIRQRRDRDNSTLATLAGRAQRSSNNEHNCQGKKTFPKGRLLMVAPAGMLPEQHLNRSYTAQKLC
jgi:hypothetical protein